MHLREYKVYCCGDADNIVDASCLLYGVTTDRRKNVQLFVRERHFTIHPQTWSVYPAVQVLPCTFPKYIRHVILSIPDTIIAK
jgi:hypothetical protein